MRFFLDNCLPLPFAPALRILAARHDFDIRHLREKFDPATPDPVWLRALDEEGDWAIASGDPRISRGRAEQEAWRESGMTAFFFGGLASQKYWSQAADVVRWWPDIVLEAQRAVPGTGYLIPLHAKAWKKIYEPSGH